MKKLLFSSLFIFIILAGCSNDEAYQNAIQEGLDYIASEEYDKAESAFELALEEKNDDEKATTLLNQVVSYQEAIKAFEDGELDSAKENAEKMMYMEDGSSALVKKSEELVTSIDELEALLAEITVEYEDAQKQYEDKNYEEANKMIESILKKDLQHSVFNDMKENVEELQQDITLAVEEAKAEEERIAKEKAEQERIAKEKAKAEQAAREAEQAKQETTNGFSQEKAFQIAEKEFPEDDIGISLSFDVEYENGKPFYWGVLYSKEMQAEGGTGTIGQIKVFEDGAYLQEY